MKMKKIILTLTVITSLAMTGCGETEQSSELDKSVVSDTQVSQQEEINQPEVSREAETESPKKTVEMSDNLSDFTFTLDNIVYSIPCSVSEFLDNGWKIRESSGNESEEIQSDGFKSVCLDKDDMSVSVSVRNTSGNSKRISECQTETINLFSKNSFVLSGGIVNSSSYDDIISAYGEPTEIKESEFNTTVVYEFGYHQTVNFIFKKNILENVMITNYIGKSEINSDDTSEEVPEYLSEYNAPTELGNDLFSGNIEIAGNIYRLPVPVSVLLDDGYTIRESDKPVAVSAGNSDDIYLELDRVGTKVYLYNFADYQTIPENCAVSRVDISETDNIAVKLPGGITFDSTKDDLEALLDDDFEISEYDNGYIYSKTVYDDILGNPDMKQSIRINISKDTDKVSEIMLEFVR